MDKPLKQRMIGAIVLIALAVIFIPMLLDGGSGEKRRTVSLDIPSKPDEEYRSRLLPLDDRTAAEQAPEAPQQGRVQRDAEPPPRTSPPLPSQQSDGASNETAEPAEQGAASGDSPAETDPGPSAGGADSAPAVALDGDLANWFVQVGSFSRQSNADELRDRLIEAGYSAFTEASSVDGTATHRVKVGPELQRADAERVREEIASRFDLRGIVINES